jgi:hypothetical protein
VKTTKQKGPFLVLPTKLPREDALVVLEVASRQGLTVSMLIRTLLVPLCRELLSQESRP